MVANNMKTKKRIVVICPGRGTYNSTELGYLKKYHGHNLAFLKDYDRFRTGRGLIPLTELDNAEKFNPKTHLAGENAADLIHACCYLDFMAINRDKFEIVAITGNSMGWYLALHCAGAMVSSQAAMDLVNTMGCQMKDGIIGGQVIYPIVDENWLPDLDKEKFVKQTISEINELEVSGVKAFVSISINFGGYLVIGGNKEGLKTLVERLPKIDRFPFKLMGSGAFHTELFQEVSKRAKGQLAKSLLKAPEMPLIDGRGRIFQPWSSSIEDLHDYTLGHQVTQTYDFSMAVEVALKEFNPDHLVITGPGTTLGGAVGQVCIAQKWQGMENKESFTELQKENPFLLSMGMDEQRKLLL